MKRSQTLLQRGFTLIELLIVVIILAILAAIVVPQFASTTDEAKIASLDTTLANIRSAISLYYQQHGKYPANATAVSTCNPGTPGTGAADTEAAFLSQLTMYTDASGKACSIGDATTYKYGPYLKKSTLPANPVTGISTLLLVSPPTGDLNLAGTAASLGWRYDSKSGKFIANDTSLDPNSVSYDKH